MAKNFNITYCGAWGYRQRAVRLAAELETQLDEMSELIQGSGGIFEVQYKDMLVFSKKAENRFPEDGEVTNIVKLINSGLSLAEAQQKAAENIAKPPSFSQWFKGLFRE